MDQNDQAYATALQSLITAFNYAAPSGIEQRAFIAEIHDMQADNESRFAVLRFAVGRFYDGLAYGNWPGQSVAA